jgi:glycerophosphoryl diester phosphodiesterase
VVVIHDPTVDRTTNGKGKVNQQPLAALKELDAGSSFSAQFKGELIPTLSEVFETIGKHLYINIELTNYTSQGDNLPELVAELVRQHGLVKRVVISSFYPRNLARFRRTLPGVPVCLLALSGIAGALARGFLVDWYHCDGLNPYFSNVTQSLILRQHIKRRLVNTWTVNQPTEMRRLVSLKVDGIITDNPTAACQTIKEMV